MRFNKAIAVIIVGFTLCFVITGCSSVTGQRDFNQFMSNLEHHLHAEDWDALHNQMDDLMKIYAKNNWKLQLIGDEGEYERLHESINRFTTAVEAREIMDAKLELATIKTIIEDIYSL